MTAPTAVRFTYQDYRNLPEESRYDIVDGDLQMSPSPTTVHQRIVLRLAEILSAWARSSGAGEVFVAPCDVILSETDVVQPDVLFVSRERDRTVKAKLYARAGVRELWLVDPASRTIEVLTAAPSGFLPAAIFRDADRVRSAVVKGLDLDPGKIF